MDKKKKKPAEKYMCEYCDHCFDNKAALGGHKNLHRKTEGKRSWKPKWLLGEKSSGKKNDDHHHAEPSNPAPTTHAPADAQGSYQVTEQQRAGGGSSNYYYGSGFYCEEAGYEMSPLDEVVYFGRKK